MLVANETPSAWAPNGPLISDGTSRDFCAGLRGSKFGFNFDSKTLNGKATGRESYSSATRNNSGAAPRNWPKVILTEPSASCGKICSIEIAMLASPNSSILIVIFARKSCGNFSRIGCNGISTSLLICAGAETGGAVGTGCGLGAGETIGAAGVYAGTTADCGGADFSVASSVRRNHPRNKPANFIVLNTTFIFF